MKKIFTLVLLVLLSLFFVKLYLSVNTQKMEPINEVDLNDYKTNFSIDKTKYYPLETAIIKIEAEKEILPMTLRIVKDEDDAQEFISMPIKSEVSEIQVIVGGELGEYTIYLEKNGKFLASKLHYQLDTGNYIRTGDAQLDGFFPQVKEWMQSDISQCDFVQGYRSPDTDQIWLRDHTYQMKAFKYWESNVTDLVEFFLDQQKENGSLPDFICPTVRMEVEADVEYLSVLAAYGAWQASGDDEWIFSILPKLEKALLYSMTDPFRWDENYQLVKRPFTIDFWDFQWGDGSNHINDNSQFGILASDNSGVYQAAKILAKFFGMVGNEERALYWEKAAQNIKKNSNEYLWNSQNGYYKSFLHLDEPVPLVEIEESKILSLGNVYNINRSDFTSQAQARSIIQEYQNRANITWRGKQVFKEWFSINPDYGEKKFNSHTDAETSGGYVNGSIMPLVGGELASGALRNGFEEYGVKNIRDYIQMTTDAGDKTYLWYWPDGTPGLGLQTLPTDGWGSSAFLSAFVEELVGIKDLNKKYNKLYFSPKWPATDITAVKATIKYGASDGYVAYQEDIIEIENRIVVLLSSPTSEITAHILLPKNKIAKSVVINDMETNFTNIKIGKSNYVDFIFENEKVAIIDINYEAE